MKHSVILKTDGYYTAFPVLDHLPDGRLSIAIPRAPFRDHHAVQEWIVLVSTDNGHTWNQSDDPTVPANWPGNSPREKYDRFCKITENGTYICTGTMGWEVRPAGKIDQDVAKDFTVLDHPHDPDSKLIHQSKVFIKRSHDEGNTWETRQWKVPLFRTLIGFPRADVLDDGTILVPLGGRPVVDEDLLESDSEEFGQTFAWRSTDDGDSFTLIPLPMGLDHDETAFLGLGNGKVISLGRTTNFFIQRWSDDSGLTWSQPVNTNIYCPASPPNLVKLRDGRVLCTYGHRLEPMGIRAVISHDDGETWDVDNTIILRDDGGYATQLDPAGGRARSDNGYPMSTQLPDGSIFTVYYITLSDRITHVASTHWEV